MKVTFAGLRFGTKDKKIVLKACALVGFPAFATFFYSACNGTTPITYTPAKCAPKSVPASELTLKDAMIKDASGRLAFVTAHDGQIRSFGEAPPPSALHTASPPPSQTPGTLPSCVMLDAIGLETPVKDQGGRGTCTIFAAIGTIESEYLLEHQETLDLSEEYVINMMNETRAADWAGGGPTEKLAIAAAYGVPLEMQWPYISKDSVWQANLTQALSFTGKHYSTLEDSMWKDPLTQDLANYNSLVYPGSSVNLQAFYGPLNGTLVTIPNEGDPVPFETVLNEHHSIAFETVVDRWKMDPISKVIGYDAEGSDTKGHSIILVGYDHDKQTFRIKNSWGATWNGDGYADITYELFLKTASDATYVTQVKSPQLKQAGGGVWRGFWAVQGQNSATSGVAVIHHAYSPVGPLGNAGCGPQTCADASAAQIFSQDGSTLSYPEFVSGDASSATFKAGGSSFRVKMIDAVGTSAKYQDLSTGAVAIWTRCNPTASGEATANYNPSSYPDAVNDPYVLPPCNLLGL